MNFLFTVVRNFQKMIEFLLHQRFEKEFAALQRRFPKVETGLNSLKRICETHFHPLTPRQVLPPGKLHRVSEGDGYVIWKVEMAVEGLRKNQSPRIWFAVKGAVLLFLCIKTHIDNYDNNECDREAGDLVTDFF